MTLKLEGPLPLQTMKPQSLSSAHLGSCCLPRLGTRNTAGWPALAVGLHIPARLGRGVFQQTLDSLLIRGLFEVLVAFCILIVVYFLGFRLETRRFVYTFIRNIAEN